jgi:4-hydroxybenzoate polyprenyltransferase
MSRRVFLVLDVLLLGIMAAAVIWVGGIAIGAALISTPVLLWVAWRDFQRCTHDGRYP